MGGVFSLLSGLSRQLSSTLTDEITDGQAEQSSALFINDGKMLVTGGASGELRVWSYPSMAPISRLSLTVDTDSDTPSFIEDMAVHHRSRKVGGMGTLSTQRRFSHRLASFGCSRYSV
jgi:WD40 repeat protein